jgi:hypothetical protein
MSGTPVTDNMISFTITPGGNEFTFTYAVAINGTPNGVWIAAINFGDGNTVRGALNTPLQGSHEYIGFAGTYTATVSVSAPSGVFTKTQTITLSNDNVRDDLASLQYILTGGKDNIVGKTWKLGGWSALRPPDMGNPWWNFFNAGGAALQNDEFVFAPNSIRPNGRFTHENHGDSFMHESTGALFPDGNTSGSYVTEYYTPPTDATWEIIQRGGATFLVISNGFFGFGVQSPAQSLWVSNVNGKTEYEIIEFSAERVRVRIANIESRDAGTHFVQNGWWCYELIPQ